MAASPFDCVVTYHRNPLTCGVAKFNHILAERLGVPVLHIFDPALLERSSPFVSIKCSEFEEADLSRLHALVPRLAGKDVHLFLHDFSDTLTELELIRQAARVYCGNHDIHERLKPYARSLLSLWSPATLRPFTAGQAIGEVTVFSFGMAHKLHAHHYLRMRDLLDATGLSYTIFLSTALHEGTAFEDAFSVAFDQLRDVFGEHIRFLGFLSDDAVIEYVRRSTFFTAFFEKGVRENNSSVVAAMEQGSVVITNTDAGSPVFLRHGETMLDIARLKTLPLDRTELAALSARAKDAVKNMGWDALMAALLEA